MTLDQAITRADQQFDLIAAQNLLDTEVMVRDMGGTLEEVAAFVERQRVALERTRAEMHESISVVYVTGFDAVSRRVN